jgi:cold shock CspA family protein
LANDIEKRAYLTSKGIKIEFKNITKFAQVLEDVFVENNFTAKTLGELTNYNIRSIMALSKRIITSPIMRIEDLVISYLTSDPIGYNKFIDALICGDYQAYKTGTGDDFGIISTFKINSEKVHSPLLILRILSLLRLIKFTGRDVEERHLTVNSLIQYFEALGVDMVDLQRCLTEMISIKLIEPYDPSVNGLSDHQKLAITYKGIAHYDLSTKNNVYFYQMAVTTAIVDPDIAHAIESSYKSNRPFGEITKYVRKIFSNYLIQEDKKYILFDQDKEHFKCQRDLIKAIEYFGGDKSHSASKNAASFTEKELICKVLKYDPEKDYGFISSTAVDHDVYFKMAALESCKIDAIYELDRIYCTIIEGSKGVVIKSIDGFVNDDNNLHTEKCTIKNYNPARGFGFVQIGLSSNEAFFHKSAFPHNFQEHLKDGLEFLAEVRLKDDGKFQVRRCVKLID